MRRGISALAHATPFFDFADFVLFVLAGCCLGRPHESQGQYPRAATGGFEGADRRRRGREKCVLSIFCAV